jgi:hypothetical protein
MYDETNFGDLGGDSGGSGVLGGMVAAMERFREFEKSGYHCVAVAIECLAKKNLSACAVEYCGRVLGTDPLTSGRYPSFLHWFREANISSGRILL